MRYTFNFPVRNKDLYIEIREIILKIIFLKKKEYKKIFLESEGIVIGRYFPEGLISQAFSGVLGKRNRGVNEKLETKKKILKNRCRNGGFKHVKVD